MFTFDTDTLYWILFAIPSILIASTIHEYAHGLAAYKLGDPTAKIEGRLTLNPLKHIDPLGALAMVLFRFGWSKPVPVNEYNFEKRELGTAITAFAGPLSNILVAILIAFFNLIFKFDFNTPMGYFLFTFVLINIALASFNLIPIPPLDGHKIVRAILPKRLQYYWEHLEKYSLIILVIFILPILPNGSIASILITTVMSKILMVLGFL